MPSSCADALQNHIPARVRSECEDRAALPDSGLTTLRTADGLRSNLLILHHR